jgi:Cd2+/Zn2+-exporting ATPase
LTPIRITPAAAAPACADADGRPPAAEPGDLPDAAGRPTVARFRIATMDCAVEESEIRRALAAIAGIGSLRFDLEQRTLALDAAPAVVEQALTVIRKSGFDPQPLADATAPAGVAPAATHDDHDHAPGGANFTRLGLALALAIGAEVVGFFAPDTRVWQGVGLAAAAAAIWASGFDVYKKGLTSLRHGRLNINALMSVAVTGAFAIGEWPEAAMVMALYAIAEAIEAKAVDRARNAIKGLLELAPDVAAVRQPDGTWLDAPVATVALQALVRVRPGERVPMDGVVAAGSSTINQAPVTGESIPVDKAVGDAVFAGTINETGTLEVTVTAAASNSTLARIIHAVEEAQATRAPTQGFVERFAAIYTPGVFVLALAVALLGHWLFGWTWLQAIYKALVLLVIACPCALVISTPVTVVSGLAAAARRGILIKGGVYLEGARRLKAIALDKTGTITEGKPKLVSWEMVDAGADRAWAESVAAALAGESDHPVARAIAQGLIAQGPTGQGPTVQGPTAQRRAVSDFTALSGRGVQGQVDGAAFALGNHRLIEERGQCGPALEAKLKVLEEAGRTVTMLASPAGVLALFAVADTIKPTSRAAVAELKALGITPVMLTGDNQATASAIAHEAGIDEARGNLLPEDKLAAIKALQSEHGATAMTGDGINDAPALAQSDIGVAMGAAGTDTAMESADVVVMNDDLRRIAETVRLSRATHAVLWQNISLALGIKAVFLVLALFGSASMWMAVFADMGASLLVVGNGLRLLRARVQGPAMPGATGGQ